MFRKTIQQYRGLPREIYVLLVARTIAAMGALVYPFLTFFLSDKMNLSEEAIAQFLLIVSVSSLPASLIGGKLADRFSRKYVYVTVVLISNVFFILAGFLYKELISIAIILTAYFFLNMAMPILSAMMADLTTPENRQESFSLVYLGFNLGYAIGPMLAGLLFENYIQWIFWGQAILSMTAISLIAFFISSNVLKEAKEKGSSICTDTSISAREDNLFQALIKRPEVLLFAFLGMFPAFAYSQMGYVMPLHMSEAFGVGDGSKFYGIIWSLNGLMVAVATPLTVLIFKKMHPLMNISVAALLYTIGFGCYAFAEELFVFYLLVIVWSTGEVIIATNSGVFIANNSPVTHRARFQAIYDIIQGTGRAVSPIVMASYITNHTFGECWLLAGGGCLFASLGYALFYLKIKKNSV